MICPCFMSACAPRCRYFRRVKARLELQHARATAAQLLAPSAADEAEHW